MTTLPARSNGHTARRAPTLATVRCAIYTRKSSEEGLDREFNSLDAQRESGEAYIASMKHEGWVCLPDKYDDGGFTGGNVERPALQRLLKDIESGRIDTIVVYKVDRLSRSLMDFARIMELFERKHVSFVSVTQQFNTTHSMGRLTLNILLSFAQFEREIISERTRDKIAAARRKGKWSGGRPILGYEVVNRKLVVLPVEAERVRYIFETYLETKSLLETSRRLAALEWRTKQWTMKSGEPAGGGEWDKNSVWKVLHNITYIGRVRYKDEVHAGEHQGIIDEAVFQRVQTLCGANGQNGGSAAQTKHQVLLKGLLRCGACNCAMGHHYAMKGRTVAYRYYACQRAQKRGRSVCPHKSVPAEQIDRFVTEQVRKVLQDAEVRSRTFAALQDLHAAKLADLNGVIAALRRQLACLETEAIETQARITDAPGANDAQRAASGSAAARLGALTDTMKELEVKLTENIEEAARAQAETPSGGDVDAALKEFGPIWESLAVGERRRIVELLVASVTFRGTKIAIEFRVNGLRQPAGEPKGQV